MLEIEEVRNNFIQTCDELLAIANGYQTASTDKTARLIYDETEKLIALFEGKGFVQNFSRLRSNLEAYLNHRNIPLELFHAYFVQSWHSFLDSIFEIILKEHFAGSRSYDIRPISIEFRSLEDTPQNLADNIRQRVGEYFNNKVTADDKLTIVTKAQNVTLPEALKKNIRKHVLVRNVYQHNRGKLRARDLKHLQSDDLKYPCIEGEEYGDYYNPGQIRDYSMKVYQINDIIVIDSMVLDQVYLDFTQAARLLVP